jgi:hypothetical protein
MITSISVIDLYESVWNEPLKALAGKWEVHPVALGQLLDRHNIPRPGSGYWTKKSMGKAISITPLPEGLSPNALIDISRLQISKHEKQSFAKAQLPAPTKSIGQYPLLKGIKQSFRKPSFKWDFLLTQDFYDTNVLRVDVSKEQKDRVIRILHTLLAAMDKNKWSVHVEKPEYQKRLSNVVVVDGEKIRWRLREKLKQVKRELTQEDLEEKKKLGRVWYEKINIPAGELVLRHNGASSISFSKEFKDKTNMPLEAQLGHFIASLKASAEYAKVLRKKHEEEQEISKQKQALLRQYESLVTTQTQNIRTFFSLFEKSQRATQCRALIETITESEAFKKYSELEQKRWHVWATSIVDSIDPVLAFEMPELMNEQNCLTKSVFAQAINEAGLNTKIPVPSVSFEDLSHGLDTLTTLYK